jgi:glycosyltransferase involved in cell wall biosynthesis
LIKILHINDKIENKGGVETNIQQLCDLAPNYAMKMHWLGVYEGDKGFTIKVASEAPRVQQNEKLAKCVEFICNFCENELIDLIHVHSISNPKLLDELFKIRPVVRSMHEPRMLCPGQGKFLRKSERVCNITYGVHCFYHAYKEGCCNRHPKRLVKAYKNVEYETKKASSKYAAIFVMSNYMRNEALKVGFKANTLFLNPSLTPLINKVHLKDSSNDDVKSLVYVGRLSRTKGVHYAIKSVVSLLEQGYKVKFDIVGSGHDENYFKALVPGEFNSQFIFHGWLDTEATDSIVRNAYVFLFPSIYPEAFGISGIEAMMHAKVVVAFNVGGVTTWLKHNETGLLVEPLNQKKYTLAIKEIIEDRTKYKSFSIQARSNAITFFSEKQHMSKLLCVYINILNSNANSNFK